MTTLLIIPWDAEPHTVDTDSTLKAMQEAVGGYVECIALAEDLDLWANEEAQYSPACIIHTAVGDVFLQNPIADALVTLLSPGTLLPPQGICGTVVLSGGADAEGDTRSIGIDRILQIEKIWEAAGDDVVAAADSIKIAAMITS